MPGINHGEIKFKDLDKKTQELAAEEIHALQQRKAAFEKLIAQDQKAKYKIEVMFRHTRGTTGLIDGTLGIWESGTKLNGDGDAKAYFCPSVERGRGTCTALIPDTSAGFGYLTCASCGVSWKEKEVYGEVFFKLPYEKWAEVLVKYYALCGHNADIYMKYPKHDVRKVAAAEQAKQLHGREYERLRKEKVLYIYPLRNIIKDTSAGATLYDRFKAFLQA
jgi:hypothetical protein